jgi:hypothetical protein
MIPMKRPAEAVDSRADMRWKAGALRVARRVRMVRVRVWIVARALTTRG